MGLKLFVALVLGAAMGFAQPVARQEYLTEFEHAMGQVIQLAKAIPADRYGWRPAPGVRSVSEVFMHIAGGNLLLLGIARVKDPETVQFAGARELEKTQTTQKQVLEWLIRSAGAVRQSYSASTPAQQETTVDLFGRKATVRAVYLRLLVHVNEHMGQAVAYARINGVVPPWSRRD